MNKNKQIRRIRTLLHTMVFDYFTTSIKEELNIRYNQYIKYTDCTIRSVEIRRDNIIELKKLIDEMNISDSELMSIYLKQNNIKNESYKLLKHITQVVKRDNKGVYIGGGGSNANKVRYPSKKRSLRVWKTFYEMFPIYAERDNWDGKTSDKMK